MRDFPSRTASGLVASVGAVRLAVTDVVSGDAFAALAGGLIHPAGSRVSGDHGLLGRGGCGGRGREDWRRSLF